MVLIPIALFAPVLARVQNLTSRRKFFGVLYYHGMCVFLAYLMLITPWLQDIAQADIQYGDLCTLDWANGDQTVHYSYDDNGSMTEKLTALSTEPNPAANYLEKEVYQYNQGNSGQRISHPRYAD